MRDAVMHDVRAPSSAHHDKHLTMSDPESFLESLQYYQCIGYPRLFTSFVLPADHPLFVPAA